MARVTRPTAGERLTLRPGVYSARSPDGQHYLATSRSVQPLGRLSSVQHTALRRLASPATVDGGVAADGNAEVQTLVSRLRASGWLSITVTDRDQSLYTLVPRCPPPPKAAAVPADAVLSRFALLRRDAKDLVLESPRAWCTVTVHDEAVLAALGGWHGLSQGRAVGAVAPDSDLTDRVRRDLCWAGMMVPPGSEEAELRTRQWSPHELWFHHLATTDWGEGRYGGTWWARGQFAPLPAVREPFSGPVVTLPQADLSALRETDPPFTQVLEDRRTIRRHDDRAPLTVRQLGEFLYRCARNRLQWTDDGVELLLRPYPMGGAFGELEIYPVIRQVSGLDAGLHHYDPQQHQLTQVRPHDRAVDRLLRVAGKAAALTQPPQTMLMVTARFGRVMWKYETMAYFLIRAHVGVLYQTMYLVATAMGLAPCGLGMAGADEFTQATGLDPLVEASVGGFLLGGPKAQDGSS